VLTRKLTLLYGIVYVLIKVSRRSNVFLFLVPGRLDALPEGVGRPVGEVEGQEEQGEEDEEESVHARVSDALLAQSAGGQLGGRVGAEASW